MGSSSLDLGPWAQTKRKAGVPLSSFNTALKVTANLTRQEKEIKCRQTKKEDIKPSLFIDYLDRKSERMNEKIFPGTNEWL